ncbi:YbhB/YbcL family Raf kinase inhibitor-like protein [Microbacterium sp. LWH7-1.2]|uniref:YbhB/YbcL family Raf kinase inhibitor-like protein n=1 Tax=Microbacterium sp. LWH7-1.2 TaxID=3135257 RepID=UPI00313882A1
MALNIRDLELTSLDLPGGGRFPDRFTAYFDNAVPRLSIRGVPSGAVELALIMHDPDAPLPFGYSHWTCYGIPARAGLLGDDLPFRTGQNDAGKREWFGPRPPVGHGKHHYYFWLYALDRSVSGEPSRAEFLAQYASHVIEQARLVATYSRG